MVRKITEQKLKKTIIQRSIRLIQGKVTMEKQKNEKDSRKKAASFKPNKKFVKNAMEEYLKRGGTITNVVKKGGYYNSEQ